MFTLRALLIGLLMPAMAWAAPITLPNVLCPNGTGCTRPVLQWDAPILWGTATPGDVLTIGGPSSTGNFNCTGPPPAGSCPTTSVDAAGNWKIRLPPLSISSTTDISNQGDTLHISGVNSGDTQITNVLAGEVWLWDGQSNAVSANDQIPNSSSLDNSMQTHYSWVRVYSNGGASPPGVQTIWSDTSAAGNSAAITGFALGVGIYEAFHVPVGIINMGVDGTAIYQWQAPFADTVTAGCHQSPNTGTGSLYTSLIAPLVAPNNPSCSGVGTPYACCTGAGTGTCIVSPRLGYGLRGRLRWQGEKDANSPGGFDDRLRQNVCTWRYEFGQGDFYTLNVDIPKGTGWLPKDISNFTSTMPTQPGTSYAGGVFISDDTMLNDFATVAFTEPNVGVLVDADLPGRVQLHPGGKLMYAQRAVRMALRDVYGVPACNAANCNYSNPMPIAFTKNLNTSLHVASITVMLKPGTCNGMTALGNGGMNGFAMRAGTSATADPWYWCPTATVGAGGCSLEVPVPSQLATANDITDIRWGTVKFPDWPDIYNADSLVMTPFTYEFSAPGSTPTPAATNTPASTVTPGGPATPTPTNTPGLAPLAPILY